MTPTFLYAKKYQHVSFDVAHLYEHALINAFYSYLQAKGVHPGLMGYINGETFEGVIFIHALFYDEHVAGLYQDFMAQPFKVEPDLINRALHEVEAEDEYHILVANKDELNIQLHELSQLPWAANCADKSEVVDTHALPKSPLSISNKHNAFQNVLVGLYAETDALSIEEQVLFLRLAVILSDVIHVCLRQKLPIAILDTSPVQADDDYIATTTGLRVKNEITLNQITKAAESAIQELNVGEGWRFIEVHFKKFSQEVLWKGMAIEYYRNTGILTSNEAITALATRKNIVSLISKLKVTVRTINV